MQELFLPGGQFMQLRYRCVCLFADGMGEQIENTVAESPRALIAVVVVQWVTAFIGAVAFVVLLGRVPQQSATVAPSSNHHSTVTLSSPRALFSVVRVTSPTGSPLSQPVVVARNKVMIVVE